MALVDSFGIYTPTCVLTQYSSVQQLHHSPDYWRFGTTRAEKACDRLVFLSLLGHQIGLALSCIPTRMKSTSVSALPRLNWLRWDSSRSLYSGRRVRSRSRVPSDSQSKFLPSVVRSLWRHKSASRGWLSRPQIWSTLWTLHTLRCGA